jgi:tetratricopeptide (TPR) repeat protein
MLLELVMIVKNSGDVLRDCLRSVRPYIDHWTILDTGSTDSTCDIINEELSDVKGNLYSEPFIDFSTTRNRVFELSPKTCKYMIVLDDSYELYGGNELLDMLRVSDGQCYSIKVGTLQGTRLDSYYYSSRIIKSTLVPNVLQYRGRVHEAIYSEKNQIITDSNIYVNDIPDINHEIRTRQRLQKDIEGLLLDEKDDKSNPRTLYYLVRTYGMSRDYKSAILYCDKLISLGASINREFQFFANYEKPTLQFEIDGNKQAYKKSLLTTQRKFPERAEPVYKATVLLYDEKRYEEVSRIMERLIAFPVPVVMITILDTSIYEYCIPYLYIESHFKSGKFEKAIPLLREMLDKYPIDQPLLNMKYAVCEKPIRSELLTKNSTLVIHMGGFSRPWDPRREKSISGSEYMAINMAKEMTRIGYRVIMFGFFEKGDVNYQGIYDRIQYIDYSYFPEFSIKYTIDYLIVSRHVSNLVYYDNIKNVYLWTHDVLPIFQRHSSIFQTHAKKFRGIITLSQWQKEFIKDKMGIDDSYLILSRNAIYAERFTRNDIEKIPFRFIYMSDASRGLCHLIKMLPQIKERYPLTTLSIFTKIEYIDPTLLDTIKTLDYVTLQPRVSQDAISTELLKSDIWLYPTDFEETYCISALEAMAAGCLVATVKCAGLQNTVADRGIMCSHPISENHESLFKKLCFVLDRPDLKERYTVKAREWALAQTYQRLALEWKSMFSSSSSSSLYA